MDANCRELGYTSMTDNISTSPNTNTPKSSSPGAKPSPLVNEVIETSDTQMMDVPGGTLESNGANG